MVCDVRRSGRAAAATCRWCTRDGALARAVAEEGLALALREAITDRIPSAYIDAGHAARAAGDLEAAREYYEACARTAREFGIAFMTPYALQNLALVYLEWGD